MSPLKMGPLIDNIIKNSVIEESLKTNFNIEIWFIDFHFIFFFTEFGKSLCKFEIKHHKRHVNHINRYQFQFIELFKTKNRTQHSSA